MDHNWGYVAAGYIITTVTLLVYGAWIWRRTRRARRTMPSVDLDAG